MWFSLDNTEITIYVNCITPYNVMTHSSLFEPTLYMATFSSFIQSFLGMSEYIFII